MKEHDKEQGEEADRDDEEEEDVESVMNRPDSSSGSKTVPTPSNAKTVSAITNEPKPAASTAMTTTNTTHATTVYNCGAKPTVTNVKGGGTGNNASSSMNDKMMMMIDIKADDEESQLDDSDYDDNGEDDYDQQQQHSSDDDDGGLLPDFSDPDFCRDLMEEELGSVLEEDFEAAISALLSSSSNNRSRTSTATVTAARTTPSANTAPTVITRAQQERLQRLMAMHYQLLLQQAVLAIRTAYHQKSYINNNNNNNNNPNGSTTAQVPASCGVDWIPPLSKGREHVKDLVEILDCAVDMLQDLDVNCKDAIRNSLQLDESTKPSPMLRHSNLLDQRALLPQLTVAARRIQRDDNDGDDANEDNNNKNGSGDGISVHDKRDNDDDNKKRPVDNNNLRLTRAAFKSSLQQQQQRKRQSSSAIRCSSFDIAGLAQLAETFSQLDKCMDGSAPDGFDILQAKSNADACRLVFQQSGAMIVTNGCIMNNDDNTIHTINNTGYNEAWIPGVRDLSEHFCDPKEIFGADFCPPLTIEQLRDVRKNRNLFTSGEDNLVLRGVNLYGEKQWILIADRYLPDRSSVNIISQRYSTLCVMLYRAHGINIDASGNLEQPPKLESIDDINETKVSKLRKVEPPAIFNVHRWSLKEDLTLLKAVPLMGHMWTEIAARIIPHRDRNHLRKRYQVLERRVRGIVARARGKSGTSNAKKVPTPIPAPVPNAAATAVTDTATANTAVKATPEAAVPVESKASVKNLTTAASSQNQQSLLTFSTPQQKRKLSNGSRSNLNDDGDGPIGTDLSAHFVLSFTSQSSSGAFERLINETSADWSQLTRLNQLTNDEERVTYDGHSTSGIVLPGQFHLEREVSDTLFRLPQMELDGLSNLTTASFSPKQKRTPASQEEESVLASVLRQNRKVGYGGEFNSSTNAAAAVKNDSPSLTERVIYITKPSTPSHRPTAFSAGGTSAFRPATLLPSTGCGSSISSSKNGLHSPFPRVCCLAPKPDWMLNYPLPDSDSIGMYFPGSEESNDGFQYCDFISSEQSRQALEVFDSGTPPKLERRVRGIVARARGKSGTSNAKKVFLGTWPPWSPVFFTSFCVHLLFWRL